MSDALRRLRRFERQARAALHLTERDVGLIRAVARHRFLRSTHLVSLAGGSAQAILRRLNLLFHHGFLDRPRIQLDYYTRGSKPMVYALSDRGARLLSERDGRDPDAVRWGGKNRRFGRIFLSHKLLVADVMVGLEVACRAPVPVRLIPPEAVVAASPEATRRGRLPVRFEVPVRYGGTLVRVGVVPDALFGLRYLNDDPGRNRSFFFLEADTGSMPVVRATLEQTSLYRKLLAYAAAFEAGAHTAVLGWKSFRVLFLTTSPERLLEANQRLGGGSRLFLFGTSEELATHGVLSMPWMSGRGERVRLGE
jgi:hypothetical protein